MTIHKLARFALGASAFAFVSGMPIFSAQAQQGATAEELMIEEVVVVGSRIQKPDYAYSNPVVSLGASTLLSREPGIRFHTVHQQLQPNRPWTQGSI